MVIWPCKVRAINRFGIFNLQGKLHIPCFVLVLGTNCLRWHRHIQPRDYAIKVCVKMFADWFVGKQSNMFSRPRGVSTNHSKIIKILFVSWNAEIATLKLYFKVIWSSVVESFTTWVCVWKSLFQIYLRSCSFEENKFLLLQIIPSFWYTFVSNQLDGERQTKHL